jgi:hypothetical protein
MSPVNVLAIAPDFRRFHGASVTQSLDDPVEHRKRLAQFRALSTYFGTLRQIPFPCTVI